MAKEPLFGLEFDAPMPESPGGVGGAEVGADAIPAPRRPGGGIPRPIPRPTPRPKPRPSPRPAPQISREPKQAVANAAGSFGLKAGRVYRLTFAPVFGLKSFAPKQVSALGKKVIVWGWYNKGKREFYLFVLPLQNPIPAAAVVAAVTGILGGAIAIALLREVKDVSGIFYAGLGVAALYLLKQMGIKLG